MNDQRQPLPVPEVEQARRDTRAEIGARLGELLAAGYAFDAHGTQRNLEFMSADEREKVYQFIQDTGPWLG